MKILSVIGARPQFIKLSPFDRAIRKEGLEHFILHTGQHYDYGMSKVFFEELQIPEPDLNLNIGSGEHGWQTGKMLTGIEKALVKEEPNIVIVYGDTNSTLAGALAAAKLHIPIAHIEAGLRSFNKTMPEEHNRILTDHCAELLFCPTEKAVENLEREGIKNGVFNVGDIMYDALLYSLDIAKQKSTILQYFNISPKKYLLTTIHRAYTADERDKLAEILAAFEESEMEIIFPLHPRTKKRLQEFDLSLPENVRLLAPLGYMDMLILEKNAFKILTDSGGMQKEAYLLKIPCITLRPETEWIETVESGWNTLVGSNKTLILEAINKEGFIKEHPDFYGNGQSALKVIQIIKEFKASTNSKY